MLEKYDLTKKADEGSFETTLERYKEQLGVLQRNLRDRNIPVVIVFEGWNAAGITMSIHEIVQALDPRGFALYAIDSPTEEERARPFLWRFWLRTPPRGRIALFARSWYSRAFAESMRSPSWERVLENRAGRINRFERLLSDDGTIVLKFFLHITKEEQKRRLEERERNPLMAWLVTPAIWSFHRHYEDSLPALDRFITRTDTDHAPWTIIEATDPEYTVLKIFSALIKTLEKHAEGTKDAKKSQKKDSPKVRKTPVKRVSSPEKNIPRMIASRNSLSSRSRCSTPFAALQAEDPPCHRVPRDGMRPGREGTSPASRGS